MANDDVKKDTEETKPAKRSRGRLVLYLAIPTVTLLCAGSGFFLGKIFAGRQDQPDGQNSKQDQAPRTDGNESITNDNAQPWYFDLEPVVANLDEPGVSRYVRTTLTLEMSPEFDQKKGTLFLQQKEPFITNWLTIYLASLTVEDIRGDQNLKRIQMQVLDILNENLFPDEKPRVKHILFKEFAVQ